MSDTASFHALDDYSTIALNTTSARMFKTSNKSYYFRPIDPPVVAPSRGGSKLDIRFTYQDEQRDACPLSPPRPRRFTVNDDAPVQQPSCPSTPRNDHPDASHQNPSSPPPPPHPLKKMANSRMMMMIEEQDLMNDRSLLLDLQFPIISGVDSLNTKVKNCSIIRKKKIDRKWKLMPKPKVRGLL